jgi:hypothetical protein
VSTEAGTRRPAVSIVVITHDARADLVRCLGSVVAHAGVPVQTILVDGASTDGTVDWAHAEHPEVEVIALEHNPGLAAREYGLHRASGELIMFLDSDAALTEGALPRMVEAMDRNPGWGLIGPRLVYDDGTLQLSCRRFPPPLLPLMRRPPLDRLLEDAPSVRRHLMADADHGRTRPVVYVIGACQLFRASLARRAGSFSDHFFWPDDIDWCVRIRDAGGEIVYFPEATVIHSYRRASRESPLSRMALEHLKGFAIFQWQYRRRRRELVRLGEELDRAALEPPW